MLQMGREQFFNVYTKCSQKHTNFFSLAENGANQHTSTCSMNVIETNAIRNASRYKTMWEPKLFVFVCLMRLNTIHKAYPVCFKIKQLHEQQQQKTFNWDE